MRIHLKGIDGKTFIYKTKLKAQNKVKYMHCILIYPIGRQAGGQAGRQASKHFSQNKGLAIWQLIRSQYIHTYLLLCKMLQAFFTFFVWFAAHAFPPPPNKKKRKRKINRNFCVFCGLQKVMCEWWHENGSNVIVFVCIVRALDINKFKPFYYNPHSDPKNGSFSCSAM